MFRVLIIGRIPDEFKSLGEARPSRWSLPSQPNAGPSELARNLRRHGQVCPTRAKREAHCQKPSETIDQRPRVARVLHATNHRRPNHPSGGASPLAHRNGANHALDPCVHRGVAARPGTRTSGALRLDRPNASRRRGRRKLRCRTPDRLHCVARVLREPAAHAPHRILPGRGERRLARAGARQRLRTRPDQGPAGRRTARLRAVQVDRRTGFRAMARRRRPPLSGQGFLQGDAASRPRDACRHACACRASQPRGTRLRSDGKGAGGTAAIAGSATVLDVRWFVRQDAPQALVRLVGRAAGGYPTRNPVNRSLLRSPSRPSPTSSPRPS